jgi:general secretion pathway protein I
VPLAVNMRMQAQGGPAIQLTTVRLVPKVAE